MNPLLDKDFLRELDEYQHKEIFAKITTLTWSELPIETIEGKVTGGSISIDGTSTVRRTCNLTIVAEEVNINNFYWSVSHKFQVEIGVKNVINNNYPDIIWFRQGIFIITTFNTTFNVTNYTVSISGKDKMCLLNGDVGGALTATTDFGSIDIYDTRYSVAKIENESQYEAHKYYVYDPSKVYFDDVLMKWSDGYRLSDDPWDRTITYYNQETDYTNRKVPIREILREAIHTYASEPYHKIIINDLEDFALELLEYRNENDPLYIVFEEDVQESQGIFYDGNVEVVRVDTGQTIKLSEIPVYNNFVEGFNKDATKVCFLLNNNRLGAECTIVKLEYGDTAGFRSTDLIYPDDLIGNVGESFTSILDKIKNMLGEFEYFYNLDGYFVFQRKKTYADVSWNPIVKGFQTQDEVYIADAAYTSPDSYSLTNNMLITAFANNPNLNNLKNDYAIHGKRTGISGAEIPIHYRFAIDHKPERYTAFPITIEQSVYLTTNFPEQFPYDTEHRTEKAKEKYKRTAITYITADHIIDPLIDINYKVVDWREILYQMAADYFKYHEWDDFLYLVEAYNSECLGGITNYERYYTDIISFWRELYVPNLSLTEDNPYIKYASDGGHYIQTIHYTKDNNGEIVNDGTYTVTTDTATSQDWVNYTEKQFDFECDYFLPTSMMDETAEQIINIENTMLYLQADSDNPHILKWYLQTDLPEKEYVKMTYEIHRLQYLTDKTGEGTMITTNPLQCDYTLTVNDIIEYDILRTDEIGKLTDLATYYYKWDKDNTAYYYWMDCATSLSDYHLDGNYDDIQNQYNTVYYKMRGIYSDSTHTYYTKWSNLVGVTVITRSTLGTSDQSAKMIERFIYNTERYPHNATDQIKTTDYSDYLAHLVLFDLFTINNIEINNFSGNVYFNLNIDSYSKYVKIYDNFNNL